MRTDLSPISSTRPPVAFARRAWVAPALIFGVWLSLFLLRLGAPFNLLDKDQDLTAGYVLDAVVNGHWLCPVDDVGDICSKPPLHTWLAGLVALAGGGRVTETALFLPGALALLLTALLLWRVGDRRFGAPAGLLAALALIASPAGAKMAHLARTDPVFTAAVFLAVLAAFHAWESGRGWIWFWLAAAAATLTKGPLGVVLGGAGLLAVIWERRSPQVPEPMVPPPPLLRSGVGSGMLVGIALYLLVAGGWFLLAYGARGDALLDKMLVRELWGHVATIGADRHTIPGVGAIKPMGHFLLRFLPWSLFAFLGFWRVLRRPADAPAERRLERFLFCQFWAGMLLFSLTSHQRPDLEFPLLPAAALLAGRELRNLTDRVTPRRLLVWGGVLWMAVLAGLGWYYYRIEAKISPVRRTAALAVLAQHAAQRLPSTVTVQYVDALFGLQFYRQELPARLTVTEAARRLRSAQPVVLAVRDSERFAARLPAGTPPPVLLMPWPLADGSHTTLVGNAAAARQLLTAKKSDRSDASEASDPSDKKKP